MFCVPFLWNSHIFSQFGLVCLVSPEMAVNGHLLDMNRRTRSDIESNSLIVVSLLLLLYYFIIIIVFFFLSLLVKLFVVYKLAFHTTNVLLGLFK